MPSEGSKHHQIRIKGKAAPKEAVAGSGIMGDAINSQE